MSWKRFCLQLIFRICALTILTCVVNPLLLVPLFLIVVLIVYIRHYAFSTMRHLKRLEAVSKYFLHISIDKG